MVQSVCLSVRHTFFTMFPSLYHHEIFRSYHQCQKWYPCKRSRSKVKVTEVKTQFSRFRTITPVWIHVWWWNDAQSLILLRRGVVFFLMSSVKFFKKSSILTHIGRFRSVTPVLIHQWLRNDAQAWSNIENVPYCIWRSSVKCQGHTGQKKSPILTGIEHFWAVTPVWLHR